MSPEDVVLCQQAIDLAQSGQKHDAYEVFCSLQIGNPEDVTVLYWIAAITPSHVEAERALETIARLEPDHPKLPALRAYVERNSPLTFGEHPEIVSSPPPNQAKKSRLWLWILIAIAAVLICCSCVGFSELRHHDLGESVAVGSWHVIVESGQTLTPTLTYGGTTIYEGNIMNVSVQMDVENGGGQVMSFVATGVWTIYEGSSSFPCTASTSTFDYGVAPGATQAVVVGCAMVPRTSEVTLTLSGLSIFPVSWDLMFR